MQQALEQFLAATYSRPETEKGRWCTVGTLVVFGGSGYAGSRIVAEAAARGHEVTAVARTMGESTADGVVARQGSLGDAAFVAEVTGGADVLVSALPGAILTSVLPVLLVAGRRGPRVGIVGGAGSLLVSPDGPRLMDTPAFPGRAKAEAAAHADVLAALRADRSELDWFYLSPAATFGAFAPGERRGRYRVGDDLLVTDDAGESTIGGEDYAIALLDEIERPAHHNVRFTVGY